MFCPEGYVSWSETTEIVSYWAEIIGYAYRLEEIGEDPLIAFNQRAGNYYLSPTEMFKRREEQPKNLDFDEFRLGFDRHRFDVALIELTILARFLLEQDALLCSSNGQTMKAPWPALIHHDQFHSIHLQFPVRDTSSLNTLYKYFEEQPFGREQLLHRFACIDFQTGTISKKNITTSAFLNSMGVARNESEAEKFIEKLIQPFLGWSIAWSEDSIPSFTEFTLEHFFWREAWSGLEYEFEKPKRSRGRQYPNAYAMFAAMNFERGETPWKSIMNRIGEATDEWPDESTFRYWERAAKEKAIAP